MPFLTLQGLSIPPKLWCSCEWLPFYNHYVHVSLLPDSLTQATEQECTNPFEFSSSQIVICAGETIRCLNWALGDYSSRERAIIRSCGDLEVDPESHNLRWRQVKDPWPPFKSDLGSVCAQLRSVQSTQWTTGYMGLRKQCSVDTVHRLCWYADQRKCQILMSERTPHTNRNH